MKRFLYDPLCVLNQRLEQYLSFLVIAFVGLLIFDVVWGVFSRFVLGAQSGWTEELARFLLVWTALLGASVAFRQKQHLGIDVVTNNLHPEAQRMLAIIVDMFILVFSIAIFVIGGFKLVSNSLAMGQQMISVSMSKSVFYLALPVSGIFTVFFSLEDILRHFYSPASENESERGDVC